MLDKIKDYYNRGLWNIDRVWNVVGKAINEKDYYQITELVYPSKEVTKIQ